MALVQPADAFQSRVLIAVTAGLLGGCANLPDAELAYYLTQTSVSVRVVRTVACDAKDRPIVVNSVTPTVAHSADTAQAHTFKLSTLKSFFSDNDVKLELYEDGRLKGLNAIGQGQGETILKSALTILGALKEAPAKSYPTECGIINSTKDKMVTLTYQETVDISQIPSRVQHIPPDQGSAPRANEIRSAIGNVCAEAKEIEQMAAPVVEVSSKETGVRLKARQPARVNLKVMTGRDEVCTSPEEIWTGKIVAAQHGKAYEILVPKPSLFGKMTTAVAFTESGALSSIQYATTAGTGQVLGVVNSALTIFQSDTAEQRAKELKARGDEILYQERLTGCLANRANCK